MAFFSEFKRLQLALMVALLASCGMSDSAKQEQAHELMGQCTLLAMHLFQKSNQLEAATLDETIDASKKKIFVQFEGENPHFSGAKAYCDKALMYTQGRLEGIFILRGEGAQRFNELLTVKDESELAWRREHITGVFEALAQLRDSGKSFQEGLAVALNATDLPEKLKIAVYTDIKKIQTPFRYGIEMFIRKAEKAYQAALGRYEFLFEHQDQYVIEGGKLMFKNAADLSAYQSIIEQERMLADQLQRAREDVFKW